MWHRCVHRVVHLRFYTFLYVCFSRKFTLRSGPYDWTSVLRNGYTLTGNWRTPSGRKWVSALSMLPLCPVTVAPRCSPGTWRATCRKSEVSGGTGLPAASATVHVNRGRCALHAREEETFQHLLPSDACARHFNFTITSGSLTDRNPAAHEDTPPAREAAG